MKVWLPAIKGGSGADVFTRRLAMALPRHGIIVEIGWFPTYFQFAPFLLSSLSPPSGTNLIHGLSWSGFAFKEQHIPLVITEQLDVLDPSYRPYKSLAQHIYHQTLIRAFMKASFKTASSVTAVSRSTAASLARIVPDRSIRVIHNFVDTRTFHPAAITNRRDQRFRLLFVGNLTRRKGADLLAPIMQKLGDRFALYYTSGLRSLKLKNLTRNMISLGTLKTDSELIAAYNDCDALLFPSRLEGLPFAPLEAMSCGKAVIASCVSSMPEVVEDGVTGILCEPNNVDEFVSACQKLADSPETLHEYGEAARQRVETLFSEDTVIQQYISLYEKLVDNKM